MIRLKANSLTVMTVCLSVAGCQIPLGNWQPDVQALDPVPSGQIDQSALPPPEPLTDGENQVVEATNPIDSEQQDITTIGEQAVAGPAPGETSGILLGRTDLLGGWTVETAADNCQLFMSLTTWSGGYRATTRGCTSAAMQAVSAWNLAGQQVSLMDSGGISVARLVAASKTRFSGQTETGEPITVFR